MYLCRCGCVEYTAFSSQPSTNANMYECYGFNCYIFVYCWHKLFGTKCMCVFVCVLNRSTARHLTHTQRESKRSLGKLRFIFVSSHVEKCFRVARICRTEYLSVSWLLQVAVAGTHRTRCVYSYTRCVKSFCPRLRNSDRGDTQTNTYTRAPDTQPSENRRYTISVQFGALIGLVLSEHQV